MMILIFCSTLEKHWSDVSGLQMMRAVIKHILDNDVSNMEETLVYCGYMEMMIGIVCDRSSCSANVQPSSRQAIESSSSTAVKLFSRHPAVVQPSSSQAVELFSRNPAVQPSSLKIAC